MFARSRSTHDLVEMNGLLYALGGNDGSNSLSTVEIYDPTSNKWTGAKSMTLKRSSVGAAVLKCSQIGDKPWMNSSSETTTIPSHKQSDEELHLSSLN